MPLTDLQLRALPFADGQKDYPDRDGMFVRVGKTRKTFMVTIRKPTRKRVVIGHYPEWTLSRARERARDLAAQARLAKDEPLAMTFGTALNLYKTLHVPTMRPGSQEQAIRLLKYFTALSGRRLTEIKTSELAAAIDAIRTPSEKMNAYIYLRALLNWSYQRGYLDHNPISRLKAPPPSRTRERVLTTDELVKVWRASHGLGDYGGVIRLLILTAQRKGQWYAFKPEFIRGDTIVFPAEYMKGNKTHVIPLTPTMSRIIGNHSFAGWSEGRYKREILELSGTAGWSHHDLRRSTSTFMAEAPLSVAPHVIERLLAHSMPGVAARYNRASYLPEMKSALLSFEEWLQALL